MGFGDFEHLAAPLGLLGKVSGFSRRSDFVGEANANSGREQDSLIGAEISLIA